MKLKGKVVLVTGSSSGIGEAIALLFAKEGAKIVVNSRRNVKGGQEVVAKIKRDGGEAIYVQADVSDPREVKKLFKETLNKYKTVDVLVNNVGDSEAGDFSDLEIWKRQFNDVLLSKVITTSEFLREKSRNLQKILNISSIYGLMLGSDPLFMAFAAAKAGVNSFTINLANKFGDKVAVNALALGYIWTKHWGKSKEKWKEGIEKATKIKRFITVDEVAQIALAVIKNDAINGQVIVVDGGATLKDMF